MALSMPPNDPTRERPLDHPSPERPHRLYFALTNHCNRSCPWCSTCSSPRGSTFLSIADYVAAFPDNGRFQVQLEGGEPTVHPDFWEFVRLAREHPRCDHLVICTNGVALPRAQGKLLAYVERLGSPLTVKLSVNHHLLDRDHGLIELCTAMRDLFVAMGSERLLVLNVRLRRGVENDDVRVRAAVEEAGLLPIANIFFLQRYGFAKDEEGWELPAPVWHDFTLINPDGQRFGPDLVTRSEGMRVLP